MDAVDAVPHRPVEVGPLSQNQVSLLQGESEGSPALLAALLGMLTAVTWFGVRQSLVYRLMQVTNSDQVLGNSTLQNTRYSSEINAFSRSDCDGTYLQTWSMSCCVSGKTWLGCSSSGSARRMQVLRVSVLQSSLLWPSPAQKTLQARVAPW